MKPAREQTKKAMKRMQIMKKSLLLAAGLAALVAAPAARSADTAAAPDQQIQLLFVQNAAGVTFDQQKGTLRLVNVTPSTLFFSDRPVRLAGHLHTESEFLPMWGESADSFVKDPPNATVSVLEPGKPDLANFVVKLMKPRMDGNDLVYSATLIEGTPPETAGATAVFIDVFGVWRRHFRRVAFVDSAVVTAAVVGATAAHANAATQASAAAAQASAAAAQASAAAAKAATTPTPPPTVIVQTAPAKPALTPTEQKLEQLKSMLNQGFITQAQYQQASQKIINEMIQ
jgi:hypothetical protein